MLKFDRITEEVESPLGLEDLNMLKPAEISSGVLFY